VQDEEEGIFILAGLGEKHDAWLLDGGVKCPVASASLNILFENRKQRRGGLPRRWLARARVSVPWWLNAR
jgi:hypothetical protein